MQKQNTFPESVDCCLKLRKRKGERCILKSHKHTLHEKYMWNNDYSTGFILHGWYCLSLTSAEYTDLELNTFSAHWNIIPNTLIPNTKRVPRSNQNYALRQHWKDDLFKGTHIQFQKKAPAKAHYESDQFEDEKNKQNSSDKWCECLGFVIVSQNAYYAIINKSSALWHI